MALKIKADALVSIFEKYAGKTFVSLDTKTSPDLNKKGRESGKTLMEKLSIDPKTLFKVSKFSAGLGYDYANLIKNRLKKDGGAPEDYQAGSSWHIPYKDSTVIRQHKTKPEELYFYVSLVANNPAKVEYVAGDKVIDVEDLREFLPVPKKPTNQGLEEGREVEVRTLKLASVTSLRAEGAEFIVEQPEEK
jgi:hypothetical protein